MSDREYISSATAFREFLEGSVWRDISHELEMWIEDIRSSLESKERTPDFETLKNLQGSAEAVRKFLLMPQIILDNIIEDNERKEK
jgi:hypothetical protein